MKLMPFVIKDWIGCGEVGQLSSRSNSWNIWLYMLDYMEPWSNAAEVCLMFLRFCLHQ